MIVKVSSFILIVLLSSWIAQRVPNRAVAEILLKKGSVFSSCVAKETEKNVEVSTTGFKFENVTLLKTKVLNVFSEIEVQAKPKSRKDEQQAKSEIAKVSNAESVEITLGSKRDRDGNSLVFCNLKLTYALPVVEFVAFKSKNILLLKNGAIVDAKYTKVYVSDMSENGSEFTQLEIVNSMDSPEVQVPAIHTLLSNLTSSEVLQDELRRAGKIVPDLGRLKKDHEVSRFFWILGRGLGAEVNQDSLILGYTDIEKRFQLYASLAQTWTQEDFGEGGESAEIRAAEPTKRSPRRLELDYASKAFIQTVSKKNEEELKTL